MLSLIFGILIPFLGTTLGAGMVYLMKDNLNLKTEKVLLGFAGGVMISASIWSMIIPAIKQSESLVKFSFIPATVGVILGFIFLFLLNIIILNKQRKGKIKNAIVLSNDSMLFFSVTLHNIPEGMAVGVALAEAFYGNSAISLASAFVLAVGIAIQNFPEGAIISMPLNANGMSKNKAFLYGVLSGLVEPISAVVTLLLTAVITSILPYLLGFAGGAMICVVVQELIPKSQSGEKTDLATFSFIFGFLFMMILDIVLG